MILTHLRVERSADATHHLSCTCIHIQKISQPSTIGNNPPKRTESCLPRSCVLHPTKKSPLFGQKTKIQVEVQHRDDTGSREHKDKLIPLTSQPPYLLNCEARVCTTVRLVVEADHTSVRCQGPRVRIPVILQV